MEIKYKKLRIEYKNKIKFFVCTHCEWNYHLNRYYPKADLILEIEQLKPF